MVFVEPVISAKCNFRCNMCDFWKKGSPLAVRTEKELDPLAWSEIFERLKATKVHFKAVEPLMYERFDELIVASRVPNRLLYLTTNGWFVNDHFDVMKYFHNIAITIGGIGDRHDEPRGIKGAFDRAMEAVANLKALDRYVRVSCPVTPENVDQMIPLYVMLEEMDVPIIFNHMSYIHPMSCEGSKARPINISGTKPAEMDTQTLYEAVRFCKRAAFQPRLTTRGELDRYYHWMPTRPMEGKECGVLKAILAGERYVIHPNGRFRLPAFCWVRGTLGSAVRGKKLPKDAEWLKEFVARIKREGLPAPCQRLCCAGKAV